eukprot:12113898-Heterocapsa_arctica.AAC.1
MEHMDNEIMMMNIPTDTTERMRLLSGDAEETEMDEDIIMNYHETIREEEIAVTMAQTRNLTRQRASSSNEDSVRDVRQKPEQQD